MKLQKIFIHADDFGDTLHISKTIFKCIDKGSVNSISIIVNTQALNDSLKLIKNSNIRKVLHLNITEGKALSREKFIYLTDKNGCFFKSWQRLFLEYYLFSSPKKQEIIKKEIKEEFASQIKLYCEKLHTKDICIDSHQHFHVMPFITDILIELNNQMDINIMQVRVPKGRFFWAIESFGDLFNYFGIKFFIFLFLNRLSDKMIAKFNANNIAYNDAFISTLFCGNMTLKAIKKGLDKSKDAKIIEVLLHPGYISKEEEEQFENNQFKRWYISKNRKKEMQILLSSDLTIKEFDHA